MATICSIEDCASPVKARGWCRKHYLRWWFHGDPNVINNNRGQSAQDRFAAMVQFKEEGCWQWTGTKTPKGYGLFDPGTESSVKMQAVHRWAYEHYKGPIPDGYLLDHVCHNADSSCKGGPTCLHRSCVNPEHLEPVASSAENQARSHLAPQHKTHCIHGHLLEPSNIYSPPGFPHRRSCRKCRRRRHVAHEARKGILR